MTNEPVIAGFSVTAILTAVLNLLVAFDVWNPSADQIATLTTLVVIASSIVAAIFVRDAVTPTSHVATFVTTNESSSVPRPAKELKTFAKVHLGPGETARVRLDLKDRDFAFYSVEARHWLVEPGALRIFWLTYLPSPSWVMPR